MTIQSFLFKILWLSMCLSGILFELYAWYFAKKSKLWPTTEGTILNAYIDSQVDEDSDETYSPKVKYSYRVNGVLYQSKRLFFGSMNSSDYSQASDSLFNININTKVTVYYDPKKPQRSVLQTGSGQIKLYTVVIWFGLLAIYFKTAV